MKYMNTPYLDRVNSPADVKAMNMEELRGLAEDLRSGVIHRTNLIGGHFGPDLGIVEATIALHFVFDSPKDRVVFDVSHQCYPHKMLTGRKAGFTDPLNNRGIGGYTNPRESEHDMFTIGHTSTSVSLACGVAKARDLKGETYNTIAVIGDGSLSGGEALEGLSAGAVLGSNFIVVVNDNEMSISPTNGGLYKGLAELRRTQGKAENNIFTFMGYDYLYVEEGNDIERMIEAFRKVKDSPKPVVLHIHTLKGKGFKPAEEDKEPYHWIMPGEVENGLRRGLSVFDTITTQYLLKQKEQGEPIVAVTPATAGICGFTPDFRARMGAHYTDVDICEQHAVGYISGLAANGAKPVLPIMSSFLQRSYDQLSQDMAINSAAATILVYWGGISGSDVTHLTLFDIPLVSNIPNIVYLAPTTTEEYEAMLDWAVQQHTHPVAIRVPAVPYSSGEKDLTDYSVLNKFKMTHRGSRVAIIGVGHFHRLGDKVRAEIKSRLGIDATLINPVYLTGTDTDMLEELKQNHDLVITLEDGCTAGGFGEKIAAYYGDSTMKVRIYGADKEFTDSVPVEELYRRFRLTPEQICDDIAACLP